MTLSEEKAMKLIHELEVHQIELEMQNEELMLTRTAAREAAEKYTELYDFAPTGYFTLNSAGEILGLNLSGAKMLGKERKYLITKQFSLYVSRETRGNFADFLAKMIAGKAYEACELVLGADSSQPINVNISGLVNQNGQQYQLNAVDVTKRKLAEKALQVSEQKYRDIFNKNSAVKLIIDPATGAILKANLAAEYFYGYPPGHLETMNISEINVLSPDEIKGEMDRVMIDECKYFNFRHRIASGEIRDVEVFSSPVFSDGVSSLYSIIHDITERKIAEEEIQRKSAELQKVNNEKDLFFSIIAHDLRSPFNAFLGFTQIMAEELESLTPEEIRKIAVAMRKSATNLFGLLENLLEWSRLQRGLTSFNPEAFLLRPKISSILQTVVLSAEKKGITLTIEIPDWLEVFFDPNHMGSIIRNLAFNAVKFTEAGGKINISGRLKAGNRVEIAIRDTGIGMTKEMLDKLFQLDNQSNRRGTEGEPSTGLGVIICRDLIKMGGGEILVESEERKGSVFSFTVPATRSGNLPGT